MSLHVYVSAVAYYTNVTSTGRCSSVCTASFSKISLKKDKRKETQKVRFLVGEKIFAVISGSEVGD